MKDTLLFCLKKCYNEFNKSTIFDKVEEETDFIQRFWDELLGFHAA